MYKRPNLKIGGSFLPQASAQKIESEGWEFETKNLIMLY